MPSPTPQVVIRTWNVEWATVASKRAARVRALLEADGPGLLVVTELGDERLLPPGGHVLDAGPSWGYQTQPNRRKVSMWSESPWTDVCEHAEYGFPPGRLVSGVTETAVGPLRVIGVCVPWRDAHVRSGRSDRAPWQEHTTFLQALGSLLHDLPGERTVLAGDFNQRIPRTRQPAEVFGALERSLEGRMIVVTEGLELAEDGGRSLIDHIAHTPDLIGRASPFHGRDVSDHNGATAVLSLAVRSGAITTERH